MTTLTNGPTEQFLLPERTRLHIVVAAASTAIVERFKNGALLDKTTLQASADQYFGEYDTSISFHITCLSGSLDYTTSQDTNYVGDDLSVSLSVLTTAAYAALTTHTLAALTTASISALTTATVAALNTTDLPTLTTADLVNLSTAQVAALNSAIAYVDTLKTLVTTLNTNNTTLAGIVPTLNTNNTALVATVTVLNNNNTELAALLTDINATS